MAIHRHYCDYDFSSYIYFIMKIRALFIFLIILCSCRHTSILKRHYTKGFYTTSKNDCSANSLLRNEFINTAEMNVSKNLIYKTHAKKEASLLISPAVKSVKDSVIIYRKKGKKEVREFFKNDNLKDIQIIKRDNKPDIVREIPSTRLQLIKKHKKLVLVSLIVSIIPIFGLIFTLSIRKKRNELLNLGGDKVIEENKNRLTIATVVSFLLTLLGGLVIIMLGLAIIMGAAILI